MDKNKHVINFLDYYTSLKVAPNYAVLLRGDWGSGKTWFIKKYLESKRGKGLKNAPKFLMISLYGVSSYEDIENAFFKELHPVLSSEGFKIAGALLKSFLKSTIKVDYNVVNDEIKGASVSGNVPDLQLVKAIKDNKDCVLIFDDLERCDLPISNILGYINQLVENEDIKVVILANENELINKKDKTQSFKETKEKLIGKTFEIQADVDAALIDFITQLSSDNVKEFLMSHIDNLKFIFELSNYNNLRHLRQTIMDFERFYEFLPKSSLGKRGLVEIIIESFFALSFELKKGVIDTNDILRIANGFTTLDSRKISDTADPTTSIIKKYRYFTRANPIKSAIWYGYFKNSIIDKEQIEEQILSSSYYYDSTTPEWKRLLEYYSLEENEFNKLSASVISDFEKYQFDKKETLLCVLSILLFLSDKGLIDYTKEYIIKIADDNLKLLKESGGLNLHYSQSFFIDFDRNFNEYGKNLEEFKSFFARMKSEANSTKLVSLMQAADELLALLRKSFDDFENRLLIDTQGRSEFYEIPILNYIDEYKFVEVFWTLPQLSKRYLGRAFVDRYKYEDFNIKLKSEITWLRNVEKQINMENEASDNKLTKYLVNEAFLPQLKIAIEVLEKLDTQKN